MLNGNIEKAYFPKELKFADFTTVYKKENRRDKVNYRPISILRVLSKILSNVFTSKFTKILIAYYQCTMKVIEKFTLSTFIDCNV